MDRDTADGVLGPLEAKGHYDPYPSLKTITLNKSANLLKTIRK